MKLKIILGVLAIGILLAISNQDFIFSVLADVITKIYLLTILWLTMILILLIVHRWSSL